MKGITFGYDQQPVKYRCGRCHHWFLRGTSLRGCLVMHRPGSCCHHNDTKVEGPTFMVESTS